MKGALLTLVLLLGAVPAAAQDHSALVRQIWSDVLLAGVNLEAGPGECGRFQVTQRVAWALRSTGIGLIAKFGGQNGCSQFNTEQEPKYAVDAVMYADGRVFDVLGFGAEGPNSPHWFEQPLTSSLLFRAPFEPAPLMPAPIPVPTPIPVPVPGIIIDDDVVEREILATVRAHYALDAAAWQQVQKTYAQLVGGIFKFIGKYILPIAGGVLAGMWADQP